MLSSILLLALSLCAAQGSTALNDPCEDKQITLPWGTYKARTLDAKKKICVFNDVRFGNVTTRFAAGSVPLTVADNSTVPDPPEAESCYQVGVEYLMPPPSSKDDVEGDDPLIIGTPLTAPTPRNVEGTEDCLFLDLYVPVSALEPNAPKLPVVVWIYGGAYAFGSKNQSDPLYTGQALIETSEGKAIFVAGNYRIGAFGWLAGSNFEAAGGLPNVGLYDQRLLLEWVRDHIDKVNGDKDEVSAWGESAGAGSILHHLTRGDGNQDPLFKRAVMQSPAFQWNWDRNGSMNTIAAKFSELAGCGSTFDIDCLRKLDIDDFVQANKGLYIAAQGSGMFPVGPSVDGTWATKLPAALFAELEKSTNVESIIVSHVGDEASLFTPKTFNTSEAFDTFIKAFMPQEELADVRAAIREQYDCTKPPFSGDFHLCIQTLIRDSSFTCNTRQLYDAYRSQGAWMMEHVFPSPFSAEPAQHGADLFPTFINSETDVVALLKPLNLPYPETAAETLKKLAPKYQAYLASHAVYGDPNTAKKWETPRWNAATSTADDVEPTLQVRYKLLAFHQYFGDKVSDAQNTRDICDFWTAVAMQITWRFEGEGGAGGSLLAQKPEL